MCFGLGRAQAQVQRTLAAVPQAENAAVPQGELGNAVRPTAYRLDLALDPASERFSGKVEIDVVLNEASSTIVLHARELAIRRAEAVIAGARAAASWREADPSGVLVLEFPQVLPPGPATLAFDYEGEFNTGPSGLFRVEVGGEWYSWSQFQSIDARFAFPCFDQPSFKTPFTITLRTPPGLIAVSNAPETSTTRVDGLEVHRFAPTLPLPTYLVAMMTGPFAVLEGEVPPTPQRAEPLPLRIVSTRQNAGKLDFALTGTKEIVTLLEGYFGEAFPYPKLDQITSPVMPGAMENAGASLYQDTLLVLDEDAPVEQQRRFGMVVAHELAHQWFGDLVTPSWWDDIWLNESFANWMGYSIGDAWRPDLNIAGGALAEGFSAMATDSLAAGRPVRQRIERSAQADSAFDGITYGKGGHVIAMVAGYLGEETFRDGVRRYMAAHRHGNATSDDFFAALAAAAADPRIVDALRSFTDQQGVPLLVFSREDDRFVVRQRQYAPLGGARQDVQWDVPMCVRRSANRDCRLLNEDRASFDIAGDGPLVPNAGGAGYYRFELEEREWTALVQAADALTGGEAQAVADSLAAGVLAGRPHVEQLGRLARRLVHHPDSYASDAASDALGELASSGVIDGPGRQAWRVFRGKLYAPLLSDYGFDPRAGAFAGEDPERAQRRAQIVDRLLGTNRDRKLKRKLASAAERYLAGDERALDEAWFDVAFGAYLGRGGLDRAKALAAVALASEDPLLRPAALDALAESGNRQIAQWLLYELDDPRLRPSEQRRLLTGVILTRATREIGYGWMRENLDELMGAREGIFFAARLPRLLRAFCSVESAGEFARELRPRFADTAGALEMDRVIEKVRNCGILQEVLGAQLSKEFAELN